MTKDELNEKIESMKSSAGTLEEPDKTFVLNDIRQLEIKALGLSASHIAQKMQSISLTSIQEMDDNIQKAKDATNSYDQRVSYLNLALSFVKGALNIVI